MKSAEEFQQILFDHGIRAQSERQLALRFGEASGALDEAVPQGGQRLKHPGRGALGIGIGVARRDQVETAVLLGLPEESFLRAAAVMEAQDIARPPGLVGACR